MCARSSLSLLVGSRGGGHAADVNNKLSTRQYDEATWSTRSWLAFQTQRLSVACHMALAWELGYELGLGVCNAADPRTARADGGVAAV